MERIKKTCKEEANLKQVSLFTKSNIRRITYTLNK
jgi:hypothetical protein